MGKLLTLRPPNQDAILADVHRRVEAELEALRQATVIRHAVQRPCHADDHLIVTVDAVCTLPNGDERYLFRADQLDYQLGERYLLFPWPLADYLRGRSAGETVLVTERVPSVYPDPEYHGLAVELRGSLLRVEEWSTPLKLTDAIVLLRTGFPTIEAFRRALRDSLLLQAGWHGGLN